MLSYIDEALYSLHIDTNPLIPPITYWIDGCPTNGNLLAAGGGDQAVILFERRESKIVKSFG